MIVYVICDIVHVISTLFSHSIERRVSPHVHRVVCIGYAVHRALGKEHRVPPCLQAAQARRRAGAQARSESEGVDNETIGRVHLSDADKPQPSFRLATSRVGDTELVLEIRNSRSYRNAHADKPQPSFRLAAAKTRWPPSFNAKDRAGTPIV